MHTGEVGSDGVDAEIIGIRPVLELLPVVPPYLYC